jgi:hypothetical protein
VAPKLHMPNGEQSRRRPLSDFRAGSYYSAAEIDGTNWARLSLFGNGLSQTMPGSTRFLTRVHTNIPRGGWSGLPQGYEALVVGWRARITEDPEERAVKDWLHATAVEFRYNSRIMIQSPLSELVRGEPRVITADEAEYLFSDDPSKVNAMAARLGMQTIRLQEQLSYMVDLEPIDRKAMDGLSAYLKAHNRTLTLWIYLDALIATPVY